MGCGKSKHDVASGNNVLQRKKSIVNSKAENGTEIKDKNNNNNNVDNVSSRVQVEQKEDESVEESGVEIKDDGVNGVKGEAEKTIVQEKKEAGGGEKKTQETIAKEKQSEKSKEDVTVKDQEDIKYTNVATTSESKGEEKDLQANEGKEITISEDVKTK